MFEMGSGLRVEVDGAEEAGQVAELLAAVETGDLEAAALLAEAGMTTVNITVTFGDGGSYEYPNVPVDVAARVAADHSLYNSLLRSSQTGKPHPHRGRT